MLLYHVAMFLFSLRFCRFPTIPRASHSCYNPITVSCDLSLSTFHAPRSFSMRRDSAQICEYCYSHGQCGTRQPKWRIRQPSFVNQKTHKQPLDGKQ